MCREPRVGGLRVSVSERLSRIETEVQAPRDGGVIDFRPPPTLLRVIEVKRRKRTREEPTKTPKRFLAEHTREERREEMKPKLDKQ